jgi:hypothetical protein
MKHKSNFIFFKTQLLELGAVQNFNGLNNSQLLLTCQWTDEQRCRFVEACRLKPPNLNVSKPRVVPRMCSALVTTKTVQVIKPQVFK